MLFNKNDFNLKQPSVTLCKIFFFHLLMCKVDYYTETKARYYSSKVEEGKSRIFIKFVFLGFDKLKSEDQIGLLKGSVVEIMLLRNSQSYNSKKGDIDVSIVAKDTGKLAALAEFKKIRRSKSFVEMFI